MQHSTATRLRIVTFALIGLALLLRLGLIALNPGGGFDLDLYVHFGQLVAAGQNPYLDQSTLAGYADMPPAALLLFGLLPGTLRLRLLFVAVDALILLLLRRRLYLLLLYAFHPVVLAMWVVQAEDKNIIFLLLAVIIIALAHQRRRLAFLATALLAVYKWTSLPFAPLIVALMARNWKRLLLWAALFGGLFALSHLPYFPANLSAYAHRAERMLIDPPVHQSPLRLLGPLYFPALAKVLIVGLVAIVYGLYALRRISPQQLVAYSVLAAYLPAPEMGLERMVMISLPLLLVTRLTWPRFVFVAAVWLLPLMVPLNSLAGAALTLLLPVSVLSLELRWPLRRPTPAITPAVH